MKILNQTINNYRGLSHVSFEPHSKLNVFAGFNGAGKSSILDATAISLSWFANRLKSINASGRPIRVQDIHNGQNQSQIITNCQYPGDNFSWILLKERTKKKDHKGTASALMRMNDVVKTLQHEIQEKDGKLNLPLLAYYPVNRAVLDIPLRIREKHQFSILTAYEGALTSGADFRTFFEWFREREDLENENFRKAGEQTPLPAFQQDKQLGAVRKAIETFMPGFKNPTVRRKPLRMEIEKESRVLSVEQLSDGEKCLMALVGDIARRLAILNPMLDQPLDGAGVVLIDEIDLHLHPSWQRDVVPNLNRTFPNCQFFISTHSPHVLTHVQPESIHLLHMTDEGDIEMTSATESYGKNVDRVLEDLMGLKTTRPDEIKEGLREIYDLIQQGKTGKAQQKIESLRSKIPGGDPELVKADVLIQRKEILGR